MRKFFLTFAMSAAFLSASAESYTWETTSSATASSFNDIKTAVGAPNFDATTDLKINAAFDGINAWLKTTSSNTTLNTLDIVCGSARFELNESGSFITTGDVKISTTAQWGSQFLTGVFNIGGSFTSNDSTQGGFCFGHANNGSIEQLLVGGNLSGKISQFRVGKTATSSYDATRWTSADIQVNGLLNSSVASSFYYMNNDASENGNFYYKFGGINQIVQIVFESRQISSAAQTFSNLMITGSAATNGGTAEMKGLIKEVVNMGGVNSPVLKLFMNSSDGEFTQKFSSSRIGFSGGAEIMGGTLLVNYNEISGLNHGVLTFDKNVGATTAKFGNTQTTAGGTFLFDGIVVKNGGVLVSKFDGTRSGADFAIDTINLANTGISGDGILTIDFGVNEDDLIELVRDGEEQGVKIISWNVGQTNTVGVNTIYQTIDNDNQTYKFVYENGTDGLYVKYVAVPEPATYAVIFAAFALVLTVFRQRRK